MTPASTLWSQVFFLTEKSRDPNSTFHFVITTLVSPSLNSVAIPAHDLALLARYYSAFH
jgi:hypothetical protein